MMDLDSAIQHCEEVAIREKSAADGCRYWTDGMGEETAKKCEKCAEEHQQLAEWLKELKAYKEGVKESRSEIPNTCGDAISRQAAIEEIRFGQSFITKIHPTGEIEHLFDKENKALEAAVERIEKISSVTPQQRTGRWIKQNYGWNWQCSECGFVTPPSAKEIFTFCPKCGCKMREVEE